MSLGGALSASARGRFGCGFMRRGRSYAWLHLPGELPAILSDFEGTIERSQAEAQKATKISEAIMAAAKSIEIALKDFKTRIADLETAVTQLAKGEAARHGVNVEEVRLNFRAVQRPWFCLSF